MHVHMHSSDVRLVYGMSGRPVARCVSCKLLTSHTTCLECRPDVRLLADPGWL